jgi:hypothetical protein
LRYLSTSMRRSTGTTGPRSAPVAGLPCSRGCACVPWRRAGPAGSSRRPAARTERWTTSVSTSAGPGLRRPDRRDGAPLVRNGSCASGPETSTDTEHAAAARGDRVRLDAGRVWPPVRGLLASRRSGGQPRHSTDIDMSVLALSGGVRTSSAPPGRRSGCWFLRTGPCRPERSRSGSPWRLRS